MKKSFFIVFIILTLCSCSYFQVRDAEKLADKGDYVYSLNTLLDVLKENSEDRRALDAFEIIYPNAENEYYDKLDSTRGIDIIGYTQALLNLLRIEDIYYSLPQLSKNSITLIKPPKQERIDIKKELAQSFYTIGNGVRSNTYEEKLRKFGYFNEAHRYNIENREDIENIYSKSRTEALGKFYINMKNITGNEYLSTQLKNTTISNINSYPLFSTGDSKNYNLKLDITLSNLEYYPPTVEVFSGVDSYTEYVYRTVQKRVVETVVIDGKTVQKEKWVPVNERVEVEIYYRYNKYVKTTAMEYQMFYDLREKNGTSIALDNKKIRYEDKATWTEYYPLHHFIGVRPFRFPVSEGERGVMDRSLLTQKVISLGAEELNNKLKILDNNRIVNW